MLKTRYCLTIAKIPFILLLLFDSTAIKAGESSNDFQFDFFTEVPLSGTLSVDDDTLVGTEFKYFFQRAEPHHFFTAIGFRTDVDKSGSSLEMFNVDIGAQYDLPNFWGERSYLEYSIGATYSNEEFSFNLIDREITNSFDGSGFKASLGLGFEFETGVDTKFFINQYDGNSTTFGISFSLSF